MQEYKTLQSAVDGESFDVLDLDKLVEEIGEALADIKELEDMVCSLSASCHLSKARIFETGSPLTAALSRIDDLQKELADWKGYCAEALRELREIKENN